MEKEIDIENNRLIESEKKFEIAASTYFDYQKLIVAGEHFLRTSWEEDDEEIIFTYDIRRLFPLLELKKEEYIVILNILMQISDFEEDMNTYQFSLKPENLYFNSKGIVRIKKRDLKTEESRFLGQYKALIACLLFDEYKYDDYLQGGEDLFQKNEVIEPLLNMQSSEEIVDYLEKLKQIYIEKQKRTKILISKRIYRFFKIGLIIFFVLAVGLGIYSGIVFFKTVPYLTAINTANNAYIENSKVNLIDALKNVLVDTMDIHQKYILAQAYLQGENLTDEQKNNILDKMSLNSNVKEMEYWIFIGRLDAEQAEDRAMQLSDDELLLYAYMLDKSQTESNTNIPGEEKEQRLKDIQSRISELAKKYDIEQESEKDDTDYLLGGE